MGTEAWLEGGDERRSWSSVETKHVQGWEDQDTLTILVLTVEATSASVADNILHNSFNSSVFTDG